MAVTPRSHISSSCRSVLPVDAGTTVAPIFSVAHYGIVGDLNQVIPMMIRAIKERAQPAGGQVEESRVS